MKFSILSLTACLFLAACSATPDANEAPAPASTPEKTVAAETARVQPEVRYYEIADT